MPSMTFAVYGRPAPKGSKRAIPLRNGRTFLKEQSPRYQEWIEAVKAATRDAMGNNAWGSPDREAPVSVTVTFLFQRPKSHFGTGRNAGMVKASAPAFMTQTPDVDKLLRSTLDGLVVAGAVVDDRQFVRVETTKMWAGDTPSQAVITVSAKPAGDVSVGF